MAEKKNYSEELKIEALRMVVEQGMSQKEVSDLLNIPKGTIGSWASKNSKSMETLAPGAPTISDLTAENRRLRKELATAQMEKEILKKAAAYFAKESLPGTRS